MHTKCASHDCGSPSALAPWTTDSVPNLKKPHYHSYYLPYPIPYPTLLTKREESRTRGLEDPTGWYTPQLRGTGQSRRQRPQMVMIQSEQFPARAGGREGGSGKYIGVDPLWIQYYIYIVRWLGFSQAYILYIHTTLTKGDCCVSTVQSISTYYNWTLVDLVANSVFRSPRPPRHDERHIDHGIFTSLPCLADRARHGKNLFGAPILSYVTLAVPTRYIHTCVVTAQSMP